MPAWLGHLRLDVNDLDLMVQFYTGVFGLAVRERATDEESHYAFLTDDLADGMHHRLVLRQSRDPRQRALGETTRLDHFAWEVASPAALWRIVQQLEERGVPIELADAQIAWQCYFHDPEGIRLECYCDRREAEGGAPLWQGRQEPLERETLQSAAESE